MADQRLTVITGAARGIGETTARRFVKGGDKVVIGDVLDDVGLETVDAIEAASGSAAYYTLDVTDEASVNGFIDQVEQDHGPIDVFINNAGIMQDGLTIEEFPMADHDRVWNVDYRGVYLLLPGRRTPHESPQAGRDRERRLTVRHTALRRDGLFAGQNGRDRADPNLGRGMRSL